MTNKKKRQRGTRTHGGGTQKNRRGAGNRGGRGKAGSKKHEMHNTPPLGKHGFTRPSEVQDDVTEVDLRKLDEDAPLLVDDGFAEETESGYRIDARELVDADDTIVKVLGTGQVRNQLDVVADAFTEGAIEGIEAAGGEAVRTEDETDGD